MKLKLVKNRLFALLGFLVLTAGTAFAQQHTVKGRVIAADDRSPLIGVAVIIEGTSQGTVTDADGEYALSVPSPSAVLVYSYLSYKKFSTVAGNRTVINVSLEPDNQVLDEVVVMGYTSVKKTEATSAIVTLGKDQLLDVTTPDIGNMLQGKASGVIITNASGQPGDAADIRIRGTGSISAGAGPLFVVDGVPGGSFDPNDVETITVLKDVGATAIYGADGAGGVIVVTTKHAGKNQPVQVNVRLNGGVKQSLFGRFSVMDSRELYETHRKIYPSDMFESERPAELLQRDFDWMDAIFKTGTVQDYSASVSGSNESMGYFLSVNHYNEKGSLINTNFRRTNVRLNLTAKLSRTVDIAVRANYKESDNQRTSSWATLETGYRALPWDDPYDENGEPVFIDGPIRPDNGKTWYSLNKWNILHNELYNYNKQDTRDISADFLLTWHITDWLTASSTNRFERGNDLVRMYIDPRTQNPTYGRDGYLANNTEKSSAFSTTNLLKAAYQFKKHQINGMVGMEYTRRDNSFVDASGKNMPDGMDVLSTTAAATQQISGYPTPGATLSGFGQAQYSYDNKYFLTGTFRADASSKFAPDNRVGYFPSVTGGWLVSNEEFMHGNKVLTFLKLRASYGLTGNSNIADFSFLDSFAFTTDYYGHVAAVPVRKGNSSLGWETAYMASLGLDFNLFDRVEVNFDLYNINNKDLLLNVPEPTSTGFFDVLRNVGEVRNRGIEIQVNSTNIRTKDFEWTTGFNIGFNKNKVMSLPGGTPLTQSSNSVNQLIEEGKEMYTWYMPEWLGVNPDNGDPLWYGNIRNENNEIIGEGPTNVYNDALFKDMGTATPKFSGGLVNTFQYKGFTLNVNAIFLFGNKIFNYTRTSMDGDGAYLDYNMASLDNGLGWSRWENPGDQATHPRLVMNGNKNANSISSRYLENGSFLRIRNITLSYNFPKTFLEKVRMKNGRVFLSADNVFTVSKFSGSDPEVRVTGSGGSLAGMSSMNYPVGRLFSVGLDVTF